MTPAEREDVEVQLGAAAQLVAEAEVYLDDVRRIRDHHIAKLHEDGASLRHIARFAGITGPAVDKVVNRDTET